MKTTPILSIILPIYNMERYLHRSLTSLCNQTLQNMAFICINDGSTDATADILDAFAKKDSRFIVFHGKNAGNAVAVNKGIDIALTIGCEYIGFLDPDDFVDPSYFERLYQRAKDTNADIAATSNVVLIDEDEQFIDYKNMAAGNGDIDQTMEDKLRTAVAAGAVWNKIYRYDLIARNNIHLPDFIDGWNDNYFTIKSLTFANKVAWINDSQYSYTQKRTHSLSKQKIVDNESVVSFWQWFYKDFSLWRLPDVEMAHVRAQLRVRQLYTIWLAYQRILPHEQAAFLERCQTAFPDLNIHAYINKKIKSVAKQLEGSSRYQVFRKEKDNDGNKSYYLFGLKVFSKRQKS